jgi:hypothetical protein|nr:MAG: hypothetical protein DIU61_10220 [Bacteroidota bacterium]
MYSFAQRPNTRVLDEPYYAVYLIKSGAQHPARNEVLASIPQTEAEVDAMVFEETPHDTLFIKNMAHHVEILSKEIKPGLIPVFLIRNPRHVIASYSRVMANPVMRDIGIEYQYRLFERIRNIEGTAPAVVDSGILLHNPPKVLMALCNRLGISFYEEMLTWPAGPKPYDGVWAPYWYGTVHQSQGFGKPSEENPDIPPHLEALCTEAMEYYQNLLPFAINPTEHVTEIRPAK